MTAQIRCPVLRLAGIAEALPGAARVECVRPESLGLAAGQDGKCLWMVQGSM
jgi:hypothetical protein